MEDDDEIFVCDKFEDCRYCKNKFDEDTCNGCDVGEFFEEFDPEEVDFNFQGRY